MRTPTIDYGHKVVSNKEWLQARKTFLTKEKAFTQQRDELSRERRELPWVNIDKDYVFDGPKGQETLADLFDGRSQLMVYHFMFGPEWEEGCKGCSFEADHFNSFVVHLNARDVSLTAVSRAPLEKLQTFKKRMGWNFKWVSSFHTDFNSDYHVSFAKGDRVNDKVAYNYGLTEFPTDEAPGISVFYKDADGNIFHTYSSYARGLDILLGTYNFLDLTPMGRDEASLPYPMAWLRHHDRYDSHEVAAPALTGCGCTSEDPSEGALV